ncbi:MAG TPA: NmrA family NAD(P)-binding protein [Polyangiaceae bacterium]
MFVITGATGNTGSVAAEALLAAGKKVRVVVRSAEKAKALAARGAEVFTADLSDEAALARAFEGAEGVYLLSPPDVTLKDFLGERKKLTDGFARVAKAAGVKHVVLLSSIGAQHSGGTGMIRSTHAAEEALRATGLPVTFVRAAYFIENWAAVLQPAQQDGVLPSFIAASQAIPMVASRDIGKAIAQALLDGPRGTRVIELAGPVDVKPSDVAAALSKIFGKPVNVAEAPLSAVVPTFTSFGFSENVAGLFRELYEGVANGKVAWQASGAELQRGSTTVEQTLRALTGKQ